MVLKYTTDIVNLLRRQYGQFSKQLSNIHPADIPVYTGGTGFIIGSGTGAYYSSGQNGQSRDLIDTTVGAIGGALAGCAAGVGYPVTIGFGTIIGSVYVMDKLLAKKPGKNLIEQERKDESFLPNLF